jgi:chemotaxis protein CheD
MHKTHYLLPGMLFAHFEPHTVTTILGSCIAVCLWDPKARIGGMNHFLLPLWNGEGLPTPRYGNIAIVQLIEKIESLGGARGRLIAKVFGGSSMWAPSKGLTTVGERNISLCDRLLAEHRIPVAGSDVGGELGRKIIFHTQTGEVLLRRNRSGETGVLHPARKSTHSTVRVATPNSISTFPFSK